VQLEKHSLQSTSTEEGIIIAVNPLSVNAYSSIRCNVEFDLNITDWSDLQLEKHHLESTLTDEGIIIVVKPLLTNAYSLICCNFEFDSNVTDANDLI
jgi:hypothetical protein